MHLPNFVPTGHPIRPGWYSMTTWESACFIIEKILISPLSYRGQRGSIIAPQKKINTHCTQTIIQFARLDLEQVHKPRSSSVPNQSWKVMQGNFTSGLILIMDYVGLVHSEKNIFKLCGLSGSRELL